jgi:flagellar basal body-associated protein FliL
MAETSPLAIGIVGISIPVALVAVACVSKSVVVLILAVIAMFAVGAATLTFVLFLASDVPDEDGEEAGGESHVVPAAAPHS